jgi:hypothetical protein
MNMNFKLDLDYKKWLPILRKAQPYVYGVVLVGVFGYTAVTVNNALDVKPDPAAETAKSAAAKVSFDKKTIEVLKNLDVVQGTVPTVDLGSSDPFK